VISAAAKLLPVFVALGIAGGDVRGATMTGVAGLLVIAGGRVVASGARVNADCDLRRALALALLESDVLSDPTPEPSRSLAEPTYNARLLITETVPELAASVVASLLVAPILISTLPARALVLSGLALVVVMAVLVALSRVTSNMQRHVWQAQAAVLERAGFAIEGRLELVARGAEEAAMSSLDRAIERYRGVARRGAWGAAVLGRAPLAAGLAAVLVVLLVDTSYREAVTSTVLAKALVLAACLPIVIGVVLRANELVRYSAMLGPVLDVLGAPRRAELARKGSPPPGLPTTIAARGLTFSYGADVDPTLRDVSFEWRPGTALVIEGPNGAGKSTLMRLVLGLCVAQEGSLTVDGADLASLDLPALRRGIAYLPQRPYLGEAHSTVRSALRVVDDDVADAVLTSALSRVGLVAALSARGVDAFDVTVGELSTGQRQRVALARLLVHDAAVYLLDEPDANLDRAGIALVAEIVAELLARGRMVAIAAHTEELTALTGTHVVLG
jgi:ABC-type multidrug transport system fused ATPase/permease subunit